MADKAQDLLPAAIITTLADIQKEVGELMITAEAERSALRELFPQFEDKFARHLESPKTQHAKHQYERKTHALLEIARKLSKI
jgi:hypothetical protein